MTGAGPPSRATSQNSPATTAHPAKKHRNETANSHGSDPPEIQYADGQPDASPAPLQTRMLHHPAPRARRHQPEEEKRQAETPDYGRKEP